MVLQRPSTFLKPYFDQVMLSLTHTCRYYLYRTPCDMRLGIYSLSGLVTNELGANPLSGDVFVFIGKRGNQVRLLQWDRDGFALYIKKLEQGTFEWPEGEAATLTSHQMTLLMEGVMLKSVRLRKRYTPLNQV